MKCSIDRIEYDQNGRKTPGAIDLIIGDTPLIAVSSASQGQEEAEIETVPVTIVEEDLRAKVILFNDDWHTFEEVIEQIIKATGYSYARAEAITWEVHTRGKAVVYQGTLPSCLQVSAVLEEIQLKTQIVC